MAQYCTARMMRREIRRSLVELPNDLNHIVRQYAISAGELLEEYVMTRPDYDYTYTEIYSTFDLDLATVYMNYPRSTSLHIVTPYTSSSWVDGVYTHKDLIGALQEREFPWLVCVVANMINTTLEADI